MSQAENGRHRHLSSFSENEGYPSSSAFSHEPSVTNSEDSRQDSNKPSQTNYKGSLKDDRTRTFEQTKVELKFEDLRQKNPLGTKAKLSDEALCEQLLKNELSCPEDGEVVETDEAGRDLEEGEIQETPNEKSVDTFNCRYYQMGFCVHGKDCRFFHVSDKGLYRMIDLSVSVQNSIHHPSQFPLKQEDLSVPPNLEIGETSWDRALKEAMDRIESKRKTALSRENLRMTIQSVDCIDEKHIAKESHKNSFSRSLMRKTHGSSRSRRKTTRDIVKPVSPARNRINVCSFKRSKTPRDMRWSPKSIQYLSHSRSRSRSSCASLSSSCSSTVSTKRGCRTLSSCVANSYWKRHASSSSKSSSTDCVSKISSRRFKRRKRKSRYRYKSSKTSGGRSRSPVTILNPKRLERESCRLSRREIPRRSIPSKFHVGSKSTPSYTIPCDKSCSDMSISPLSNLSNQNDDQPENLSALCCCSDRHVSDMSISPLSDISSPSRVSEKIEGKGCKSSVDNFGKNIIRTESPNGRAMTKSGPHKNIAGEIPLCRSSNVSKPTSWTNYKEQKTKKRDPLVMDLMKFHQNFGRYDVVEGVKNKPKTRVKTTASEVVDKPYTEMNKVKLKANSTENKLSKKENLLKRLQDINAAIERKKLS